MTSLLNRAATKRFVLQRATELRFHTFTRVSPEFLATIEQDLRAAIAKRIAAQPSKGTTLKP